MRIKVKFFAYFREIFGGREKDLVLPDGSTVGDLLDNVCDTAKRRSEVFNGPKLQPLVIAMKNGTSVQSLDGLKTSLQDGDVIALFPFVGGG